MIRTYIGEKANNTHENIALEDFLERLTPHYESSYETITVIANALWNGAEIDAVCFLPSAIVVIDFKNYTGRVEVYENGPWRSDSGIVRGGSKSNPLAQVRDNKYSVIKWLQNRDLLSGTELGHVSGAVVFTRPVTVVNNLDAKVNTWFHVLDLDHCVEVLSGLSSPRIKISTTQVDSIVDALGVTEYRSKRQRGRMLPISSIESKVFPTNGVVLTSQQQDVYETCMRFATENSGRTLSVLGMTSTGKTTILKRIVSSIQAQGRQVLVLFPNLRIAQSHGSREALSIYSHLYYLHEEDDDDTVNLAKANEGETVKQRVKYKLGDLKGCKDDDNCLYLIDDAHLVGNDLFETEDGGRFGSGRLANDFFSFSGINSPSSKRQVILFGDPYQLLRGAKESLPLFGEYQRQLGLTSNELFLDSMYEDPKRAALLLMAREIVKSIVHRTFTDLHIADGPGLSVLSRAVAKDLIVSQFRKNRSGSWWIAASHKQTKDFNQWIRKKLHGDAAINDLVNGDMLEARLVPTMRVNESNVVATNQEIVARDELGSRLGPIEDPEGLGARTNATVFSGDRLIVCNKSSQPHIKLYQTLNGRDEDVDLSCIQTQFIGYKDNFVLVLQEYLLAEKPELKSESAIGLRAFNKSVSPEHKIALFRYGYATTAHHAQGMNQPYCFVDAAYEGGRHSDGYFRWLYTAITRASDTCHLINFKPLHHYDNAVWSTEGTQITDDIAIGIGLKLNTIGDVKNSEYKRYIEPLGWTLQLVTSHSYQEKFTLNSINGESVVLYVSYNKEQVVTGLRVSDSGLFSLVDLAEATAKDAIKDDHGRKLVQWIMKTFNSSNLRVVGALREGHYRLRIIVVNVEGERGQIEVNHDKDGLVSSVRLLKTTGPIIGDQLTKVFLMM
jgi:hypothetical protein